MQFSSASETFSRGECARGGTGRERKAVEYQTKVRDRRESLQACNSNYANCSNYAVRGAECVVRSAKCDCGSAGLVWLWPQVCLQRGKSAKEEHFSETSGCTEKTDIPMPSLWQCIPPPHSIDSVSTTSCFYCYIILAAFQWFHNQRVPQIVSRNYARTRGPSRRWRSRGWEPSTPSAPLPENCSSSRDRLPVLFFTRFSGSRYVFIHRACTQRVYIYLVYLVYLRHCTKLAINFFSWREPLSLHFITSTRNTDSCYTVRISYLSTCHHIALMYGTDNLKVTVIFTGLSRLTRHCKPSLTCLFRALSRYMRLEQRYFYTHRIYQRLVYLSNTLFLCYVFYAQGKYDVSSYVAWIIFLEGTNSRWEAVVLHLMT